MPDTMIKFKSINCSPNHKDDTSFISDLCITEDELALVIYHLLKSLDFLPYDYKLKDNTINKLDKIISDIPKDSVYNAFGEIFEYIDYLIAIALNKQMQAAQASLSTGIDFLCSILENDEDFKKYSFAENFIKLHEQDKYSMNFCYNAANEELFNNIIK